MIMGVEELGLTSEIMASILSEEKVLQLEKKFILAIGIHLEVPRKNERIIEGMARRTTLHEESVNVGLKIFILPAMADLV